MFKKIKNMLHDKKGFTLIELLVVISIIGILSTVIGVNYSNAKKSTRDTKRKADIENVAAAFEMYYSEFKNYPNCPYDIATEILNDAGYLTTIPSDPANNSQYQCTSSAEEGWFGIYAKLEKPSKSDPTLKDITDNPSAINIKQGNGTYKIGEDIYYRVVGE